MAARLINLKCEYNIPHRAIDGFALLPKDIYHDDNRMTEIFYATKKILAGLKMPHERINVCPKGCMLFWKDVAYLDKCKVCYAQWYRNKTLKGKLTAKKQMIYFPLTPRLQRLYARRM